MTDKSAEIEEAIHSMFERFVAHDAAGVEAALHEDCTVWDVFQPDLVVGRENRLSYHEVDQAQSQARGALDLRITMLRTDVWGDTGLARYIVSFDYAEPNATSGSVRITSVLRFEDGRWQIVHHQEGMIPAGIPPITSA
jgi:ketosteroid isomerase-like protein